MENIIQILAGLEIEVPEGKRDALNKAVAENYKTVAEVNAKAEKIATLEKSLDEANAAIEAAKGADATNADEIAKMQERIKAYEDAEAERAAEAAEAEKRGAFDADFEKALDGRKFASELTRAAVADKVYGIAANNPDMQVSEIIKSVIGDDDVFANPQQDVKKMPNTGIGSTGSNGVIQSLDQLHGMSVDEIRAHMGEIDNLIKNGK